ncbi:MAG: ribose 5-phosphate isomerase B [Nitrospinales bacterium]
MKSLVIASDHAGYDLKESVKNFLKEQGVSAEDLGTNSSAPVDYPDLGLKLAKAVSNQEVEHGIIICGTGIGMSIVVNRFPGIRGTLCVDVYTAKLCREHNDSNILIMGGRVVGQGLANEIVRTWLMTPFEGGRHQKRLDKINGIEELLKNGGA